MHAQPIGRRALLLTGIKIGLGAQLYTILSGCVPKSNILHDTAPDTARLQILGIPEPFDRAVVVGTPYDMLKDALGTHAFQSERVIDPKIGLNDIWITSIMGQAQNRWIFRVNGKAPDATSVVRYVVQPNDEIIFAPL